MINSLMLTVLIIKSIFTLSSFIESKRKSRIFVQVKRVVCPIVVFIILNGLLLLLLNKPIYKNSQLVYFNCLTLILLIDFLKFKIRKYE